MGQAERKAERRNRRRQTEWLPTGGPVAAAKSNGASVAPNAVSGSYATLRKLSHSGDNINKWKVIAEAAV